MPRAAKYVEVKGSWMYGRVNEEHLAQVIAKAREDGWVYQGIEDHGWILNRKWAAEFTKENPTVAG